MNKSQKYFVDSPYHSPRIKPKPLIRSPSGRDFMKQTSNSCIIVLHSIQQERQLLKHLSWRYQATAPIVRILNYTCEESDYGFPKMYRIEVQPMARPVQSLKQISLGDSLYLLKTIITGLQFLSSLSLKIDINELSYNINHQNQCKIWISNNFANFCPDTARGYSPFPPHIIITSIFNIILSVSNNAARAKLQQIIQENKNYGNSSFERVVRKIDIFIQKQGLIIGQALGKNEQRLLGKVSPAGLRVQKPRYQSKPIKINFRYFSPNSKESQEEEERMRYKSCYLKKKSIPKVTWHYESNQNSVGSQQLTRTATESSVQKSHKVEKPMQNLLKSSEILKHKLSTHKTKIPTVIDQECSQDKISISPQLKSRVTQHNSSTLTTEISQVAQNQSASKIKQTLSELKKQQNGKNTQISAFLVRPDMYQKIVNNKQYSGSLQEKRKEPKKKWQFKLTNLLPSKEQELKQSISLGEELKSSSLNVKLQFLDQMGRQIASSTIQESLSL